MQCLILAGGLAQRMRPITDTIPKALIPIDPRPFAHFQLSWLAKQGITEVIYSIGYLGQMIRDYVRNGSNWGLKVTYVDEGSVLQGTGGAIRKAFDEGVLNDTFFVTYGDSYLPIAMSPIWEAFKKSQKPALMVVFRNEGKWDGSNVCYQDGMVLLYDKKGRIPTNLRPGPFSFIDYGISILSRQIVGERIPSKNKFDLSDLFHDLSTEKLLAGYESDHRFYEIGSASGLQEFQLWIQAHPEGLFRIKS